LPKRGELCLPKNHCYLFLYASIATGYKAGGFGDAGTPDYDEENLINYELGIKSDLADGKLRLNGALFMSDCENLQVTAIEGTGDGVTATAVTRNAGEATIQGLVLEFTYLPTTHSRLSGFVAYTDATLEDFSTNAETAFTDPNAPPPPFPGAPIDPYVVDATDNQLAYTSKYSAQLTYEHTIEFILTDMTYDNDAIVIPLYR